MRQGFGEWLKGHDQPYTVETLQLRQRVQPWRSKDIAESLGRGPHWVLRCALLTPPATPDELVLE